MYSEVQTRTSKFKLLSPNPSKRMYGSGELNTPLFSLTTSVSNFRIFSGSSLYDMPTGKFNLTSLLLWLQFITRLLIKSELGTITAILSLVIMVVARAEISTIFPARSSISIRSPTFIGLSNRMIKPLMKLLVIF